MKAAASIRTLQTAARRWLARLLLLFVATVISLKAGDLAVGWLRQTQQRHLLRLPAHANYHHQSTEFDYQFVTNSLGLRGPDRPFAKPPGTSRIVVIGDSQVAGYGVANEDVFTAKLESLLNTDEKSPTEVINLGRTGSSTIRELDLYNLIGRRFEPDVVVLAYFLGNDLREVVEEHDSDDLRRWHPQGAIRRLAYGLCPNLYLELAILKLSAAAQQETQAQSEASLLATLRQECELRGVDYAPAEAAYHRLPAEVRQGLLAGRLRHQQVLPACYDATRLLRSLDPDDAYFRQAWPRTERHLNLLRERVAAAGAKFVVLVIPDGSQVDPVIHDFTSRIGYQVEPRWLTESCRTRDALLAWAKNHNVPALDLTEPFRQSQEPLYYPQDGHFNPAGHARTAELLAEFTNKQKDN